MQPTKAYVAETSCNQLLIASACYVISHNLFAYTEQSSNEHLQHYLAQITDQSCISLVCNHWTSNHFEFRGAAWRPMSCLNSKYLFFAGFIVFIGRIVPGNSLFCSHSDLLHTMTDSPTPFCVISGKRTPTVIM